MNEDKQEQMLDLLLKKAVHGLVAAEQRELDLFDAKTAAEELRSFEMTAAAISVAGNSNEEHMPAHLYAKILAESEEFIGAAAPWPPVKIHGEEKAGSVGSSWFGWLGWAAAAAACIALAFNLWITPTPQNNQANIKPTPEAPKVLTPAQMRDEMMRSGVEMVKANLSPGNMKELNAVAGDVVWSDVKQAGYVRVKGLPMNDKAKETYQLWIFDKTQDPRKPIDGGTFDVDSNGEVVIPIDAKLKAQGAAMFAITMEKAGGVVVSDRKKVAALAKVEDQSG